MNKTLRRVAPLLAAALFALAGCGGGGSGGAAAPRPPAPVPAPPPPPPPPTEAEMAAASTLAARAAFGADYATIEAMAAEGPQAWVDAQLALPPSSHLEIVQRYTDELGTDYLNADPPAGLYRRFAMFERLLTAPDQLRQRVAYALGQVMVVSDRVDALAFDPRALSSYQDVLLEHAFGNFRDLLLAVTLHPAMGVYLSHVNNARSNPAANTFPDENYAREVMQLFSIGLYELNPDGSRQLDGAGRPIATYDNDDIQEFAKIFTGLSYGPAYPGGPSFFGKQLPVLHVPMVMFDAAHEPGEKRLLNGAVVPAGQSGMADIEAAVDNLFQHPNVGPFIGRLLIQRLVTSNPSPAYIARVAAAFDGDGSQPRGDMARTIRAILLDPEALAPPADGGRLREPFVRWMAMFRALNTVSSDGTYPVIGGIVQGLTQQYPLAAPSVFNFYSPDYMPPGPLADAGLVSPEFQITTDSTLIGYANLVALALFVDVAADVPENFTIVTLDLSEYEALATDPEALLDRIDLVFTQGNLSEDTRAAIATAIEPLGDDPAIRARIAIYLAMVSPDAVVAY